MSLDDHEVVDRVLSQARAVAFPPGEYVGQQSFVTASEVLSLARRAGVDAGVRVLDLCCGVGGPGLHLTRELGCDYLGVDASTGAIIRARQRSADTGLEARFEVASIPPLPTGQFDVVLLLETMLAFRDKRALLQHVSNALPVGGRFGFTLEAGRPLTAADRVAMPWSDTVWLTPLDHLVSDLGRTGLRVSWCAELTGCHRVTVDALLRAYAAIAPDVVASAGVDAVSDILTAHRLWSHWLHEGRVRKFAVVAEKARG